MHAALRRAPLRRRPPTPLLLAALALAAGTIATEPSRAAEIEVPCDVLALPLIMPLVNGNQEEDHLFLAPECAYILPDPMVVGADGGFGVTVHGRGATLSGNIQHTTIRVEQGASLHLIEVSVRDGIGLGVQGGGIHSRGALKLTRSVVSANSSENAGGGILLADETGATLEAVNSTFLGNGSPFGGAVYVGLGASATFVNATLTGNIATHGSGIFSVGGALHFHNSIVANGFPGVDCSYAGVVAVTASGGNLVEHDACLVPGALSGDPQLGLPTGNPVYYPLLPNSPAVDAGVNDGCPDVDQRNAPRPQDGDKDGVALCDLGAAEKAKSACGLLGIEGFLLLPFARRLARRAVA